MKERGLRLRQGQFHLASAALREGIRRRLGSPAGLMLGFGGGFAAGWLTRRPSRKPGGAGPGKVRRALRSRPAVMVQKYLIWPMLISRLGLGRGRE